MTTASSLDVFYPDFLGNAIPCFYRHSARAKHVGMRIQKQGLEIVLPKKFNQKEVDAFIKQHKTWIYTKWNSLQTQLQESSKFSRLPLSINMPQLNFALSISIKKDCNAFYSLQALILNNEGKSLLPMQLFQLGDIFDVKVIHSTMIAVLKRIGIFLFSQLVADISDKIDLPYNKFKISYYKTKWGSCSSQQIISLNISLLFLPYELIEYIIIHELCHTVHFNHSKDFWSLVEVNCPKYAILKERLANADNLLPQWLADPNILLQSKPVCE